MALTPDLSVSIATTRTTQTLTDGTVFGTGGNPARADVLVFLQGYKVDFDNVATELTTEGNDDDPATDSSWSIEYTIDGFYRYYYVIVEDEYDVAESYSIYDAVYSGTDVYRSKANSNLGNSLADTAYWEAIESPALLAANKGTATESTNITSISYLRVLSANSQYEFANQLSNQSLYVDSPNDNEFTLNDYNLFAQWIDGMAVADSRSEVLDGELIARRCQSNFID
jgi:hypothetical protein